MSCGPIQRPKKPVPSRRASKPPDFVGRHQPGQVIDVGAQARLIEEHALANPNVCRPSHQPSSGGLLACLTRTHVPCSSGHLSLFMTRTSLIVRDSFYRIDAQIDPRPTSSSEDCCFHSALDKCGHNGRPGQTIPRYL